MNMKREPPLINRYSGNPILTRDDIPYPVATVHNAGIVKHNGRYIMLFRSHRHNGRSIIGRADSDDGFSFTVHPGGGADTVMCAGTAVIDDLVQLCLTNTRPAL
jgi:predicted GH43/DUF377 family glycosyl hydrolase